MTLTACFNLHRLPDGASGKAIATGTGYRGIIIILWMNLVFHNLLVTVNANLPPIISGRLEFDNAVNQGKNGIISADADIIAGMNACTSLPYQDSSGVDTLSSVPLHTEPL